MSETTLHNDRFPTDPHTLLLIAVCALIAGLMPSDRTQALAGLLAVTLPLLPTERR